MLDNLSKKITTIVKKVSGNATLNENNIIDALREVRIALLEADVELNVVKHFMEQVKQQAIGQEVLGSLQPGQAFIGVVNQQLAKLMGEFNDKLNLSIAPPAIILMSGLQGAGKTTTVIKLAKRITDIERKKVLVVSSDIYRKAAIEQLQILAQQNNIECFPSTINQTPLEIVNTAKQYAISKFFDVLIIDTAGRLAIDEPMMVEIKQIQQAVLPIETLLVVDSMLGQTAVQIAQKFHDTLKISGVILTKMDGDARGGAALSIRHVTGCPIKFIGVSEKVNGLEPFYPDRIASRILGMGDVLSLIEQVKTSLDETKTKKIVSKLQKGKKFDLEDLREQFTSLGGMGDLNSIVDKLPANLANKIGNNIDEKLIRRNIAILNSMTLQERHHPDLLKASRKRRIALGSGVNVQQVNQLLKQYEQMSDMMKKFGSKSGIFNMMKQMHNLF
jgi:signal recognition particle subunit SRP54